MAHSFAIGTQSTTTNLADLTVSVYEPEWSYRDHEDEIELGNGTVRAVGWAVASWHWGYLSTAQYGALKEFCSGKSGNVYIKTKIDGDNYDDLYGVVVFPSNLDYHNGKVIDFTLEFRDLEAV